MRFLHLSRCLLPDFLTDDFGNEFQVIPGEHCIFSGADVPEQRIVNEYSWALLLDYALEGRPE